jgi:hypothetical protein
MCVFFQFTWDGSAEGNERDGSDLVGETDGAAKVTRKVSDESSENAYPDDGDAEAQPASQVLGGRYEGEQLQRRKVK